MQVSVLYGPASLSIGGYTDKHNDSAWEGHSAQGSRNLLSDSSQLAPYHIRGMNKNERNLGVASESYSE